MKNEVAKQLRQADVLMEVASSRKLLSNKMLLFHFAWITTCYIALPFIINAGILLLPFLPLYVIALTVLYLRKQYGRPLIITSKGILVEPFIALTWTDIKEYGWDTLNGMKLTNKTTSENYFLMLYTANFDFVTRFGYSMFWELGISLSENEKYAAEEIFSRHGITKRTIA